MHSPGGCVKRGKKIIGLQIRLEFPKAICSVSTPMAKQALGKGLGALIRKSASTPAPDAAVSEAEFTRVRDVPHDHVSPSPLQPRTHFVDAPLDDQARAVERGAFIGAQRVDHVERGDVLKRTGEPVTASLLRVDESRRAKRVQNFLRVGGRELAHRGDALGLDVVLAVAPPPDGLGLAVLDRLRRASAPRSGPGSG
jgi:hypothetical protein